MSPPGSRQLCWSWGKESKHQELVCVLNNLSDLSEVLREMPCGVRRTAVGSRQLSRMGVYPLSVFV